MPGQPGMGGPPMGGMPGQPGMGGPPMGGMPGQPGMGGPPMGGMPGQPGMGGPPMGGMPGQPGMGMGGPPMGGMGQPPMGMGGMPGQPPMGMQAFTGRSPGLGAMGGFSKMRMILTAVGVGVLAIGGAIVGIYSYTHPSLHMINNTGKDGVSIYIDGNAVATNLKNAPTESWLASSSSSISSGKHKIEAKDASGKVIETIADMEFKSGSNGYLYSPMHDKNVCFVVQVDVYGKTAGAGAKDILLDKNRNFWEMPASIDRWFQDTPDSVKLGKGQTSATKRAVRQVPCNAL
ncbi:MAG: hypothetical protein U0359_22425 [Byssovorax sp.]